FASGNPSYLFMREGEDKPRPGTGAAFRAVTPDYFHAMGVSLLQGREFTPTDNENALPVTVINETMAKKYWPNENPIGRRIRETSNEQMWREIVGVVASVRHRSKSVPPTPEMFVPWAQTPGMALNLAVRTAMPPEVLAASLRRAVSRVDPELPV